MKNKIRLSIKFTLSASHLRLRKRNKKSCIAQPGPGINFKGFFKTIFSFINRPNLKTQDQRNNQS